MFGFYRCCDRWYRDGVLSVQARHPEYPDLIDHCIVTAQRCARFGKLAALGHETVPVDGQKSTVKKRRLRDGYKYGPIDLLAQRGV